MSRVHTQRTCPGCEKLAYIKLGEICRDCKCKLKEYPQLVQLRDQAREGTTLHVMEKRPEHFTYYHIVPQYWTVEQQSRAVIFALGRLALRLGTPTDEIRSGIERGDEQPLPASIGRRIYGNSNWLIRVRMPEGIGPLISDLEHAIRIYAQAVYQQGKVDGASLLNQLATGAITTDAFNAKVIGTEKK